MTEVPASIVSSAVSAGDLRFGDWVSDLLCLCYCSGGFGLETDDVGQNSIEEVMFDRTIASTKAESGAPSRVKMLIPRRISLVFFKHQSRFWLCSLHRMTSRHFPAIPE